MTTRKLTIIAQDPSVRTAEGKIVTASADIPYETLGPGPRGYRVNVIDYDCSQKTLYKPFQITEDEDKFKDASNHLLLNDPEFHAQNAYAIIMRILARFEYAFGRRISWGIGFHQLNILPHAFQDTNAFYSEEAKGIFFGYFPKSNGEMVYTCLSHDIIAHEVAHALLDGLRNTYSAPSLPEQEAFHEGFADCVAILSVFGLKDVVKTLLCWKQKDPTTIKQEKLSLANLKQSVLFRLAEEFGSEMSGHTKDALRNAVNNVPSRLIAKTIKEPHDLGQVLSAAVLNSFLRVWKRRMDSWISKDMVNVSIERVVEDAAESADHLLTMIIRALDYCPVVNIRFSDFLSSMLTADMELIIDDGKYKYRNILREEFSKWGIEPANPEWDNHSDIVPEEPGVWKKFPRGTLDYDCIHKDSLEKDIQEAFKFIWENKSILGIYEHTYIQVISLRNLNKLAPDGFVLKETVCEYKQIIDIPSGNLKSVNPKLKKPAGMSPDKEVRLIGGGVLIFDEFGRLKYHISSKVDDPELQNRRLDYLFENSIIDSSGRYGFTRGKYDNLNLSSYEFEREIKNQLLEEWG